jgi:hypothetical protein
VLINLYYSSVRWRLWLLRRHTDVYRTTTHGLIDCGHLDFSNSKVVELHRCNLSDSDWNPWASENVARITRGGGSTQESQAIPRG